VGFQLKDFVSISASMTNYAKATQDALTDFNVGSVNRTILESSAIEIEELYQRVFSGLMEAIPTAIYRAFEFDLLEAKSAHGTILVSYQAPPMAQFTIPSGTALKAASNDKTYLTTDDVVVQAGSAVSYLTVICTESGVSGNLEAGTLLEAANYRFPVAVSLTSAAILNGTDGESEPERLARFRGFIRSLNRGTMDSVVYGASQAVRLSASGAVVETVAKIGKHEQPGFVDIYLWGSSGLPSDALITAAQTIVDGYITDDGAYVLGYAPAGVLVVVNKMARRSVDLRASVQMLSDNLQTDSAKLAMREQLKTALESLISGRVLTADQQQNAILAVAGVQRAVMLGGENIVCAPHETVTIGEFVVEWSDA
jgi:uncharacterized phage protein gp47/JayE